MGFSRQEYWSRLPFPSPGDLPNPGIELASPVVSALACKFFTTMLPEKLLGPSVMLQMALFHSFLWLHNIPFGEGNGNPLQYSSQENPMDRGVWRTTVHKAARVGHDLVIKPPIFHYIVCVCVCVCVCVYIYHFVHRVDITLLTKVHMVKWMVFPVVIYGCESWTIKKTECWRIDAFELWCWRRLLRVPWIARRSNQSTLKEINTEYSLEGLMVKLKLQYFSHLMRRADSLEKTLMLEKIEDRRRGQQRTRWLDGITDSVTWVWPNSGR